MLSIQIKLSAQTTECDRGVWSPDVDPIQMFTRECLELWVVDDAMNTVQFRMLACENRFPNKELGLTCLWSAMGGGNDHCIPGNHWFPSRICKCLLHQSIYINCWLFYHVSTSIQGCPRQMDSLLFHVSSCLDWPGKGNCGLFILYEKHQISCFFQTRYKRQEDDFAFFSLLILSDIAKFSWKCR